MQTKLRKNDATAPRWFSTGFMAGGVGSVDAEKHTLHDAVLIRPGEALGHGVWIDDAFCADIAARGSAVGTKGLKARFGHPGMCSEALGTFLGRWTGTSLDASGRVIGDLHLSSTASESPKGDLRKYVEEMAAKEPNHFGASIVFSMDRDAMVAFCLEHGAVEKSDEYGKYIGLETFKSPDPANTQNLPHARCAELHAADLVDEPAATDGMFSGAGGLALAAQVTEFLDTHPQALDALTHDDALLALLERYPEKVRPFLAKYQANQTIKTETLTVGDVSQTTTTIEHKPASAEPAGTPPATNPAESGELQAKVDELSVQLSTATASIAQFTSDLEASGVARTELASKLETAESKITALTAERDEAKQKLALIEAGQLPVSSAPANDDGKPRGSMWDDARKSAKRK